MLSHTLTLTILKVDVVCDVEMTSTPNVLTTELRDPLYNQRIDNTCCYSFIIYPTGRIKLCKVIRNFHRCEVQVDISVPQENLVWYAKI